MLHLLNTALVFAFVSKLAPGGKWTIVATSLLRDPSDARDPSAWIAGRKDVLYAFFYLLDLAYLRYLRRSVGSARRRFPRSYQSHQTGRDRAPDSGRNRLLPPSARPRGVLEKLPLRDLGRFPAATFQIQQSAGAINREDIGPVFPRVLVACFGLMMYVAKALAPIGLSAIYPYPKNPATSLGPEFYLALVFVVVALSGVIYLSRKNRGVLFGVAFFLINVALVLQFVTVGKAVMADRYTYLPYVGLFFALAWGLDQQSTSASAGRLARFVVAGILLLLVPVSLVQTWKRCQVWRDSGTLWSDVIRRYPGRIYDAYNNRGKYYFDTNRFAEALADYEQALVLDPKPARSYFAKGSALGRLGQTDAALACFDRALELDPSLVEARSDRAGIRLMQGDLPGAISDLDVAIRLNPGFRGSYVNRGSAYAMTGDLESAVADWHAIELDSQHPRVTSFGAPSVSALVRLYRPQRRSPRATRRLPLPGRG